MGGLGSTRWGWHRANRQVEDCLAPSVGAFRRAGAFRPGAETSGTVSWKVGGGKRATVAFVLDLRPGIPPALRLTYRTHTDPAAITSTIPLDNSPCQFGGGRRWPTWPLADGGVVCRRRVAPLYLRGTVFGCRHCHDLSYESSQTSDRRVAAAVRVGVRGADLPGWSLRDMDLKLKVLAREMRLLDKLAHRFGDGTDEPADWPLGRVRPGPPVVAVAPRSGRRRPAGAQDGNTPENRATTRCASLLNRPNSWSVSNPSTRMRANWTRAVDRRRPSNAAPSSRSCSSMRRKTAR